MKTSKSNEKIIAEPKSYYLGIDILKITAMFFVILLHSTSFYGFNINAELDFIFAVAASGRFLALSCIPLFLIITGFVNRKKEPNKNYYKKLIVYLLEYFLCCILVWLFRVYVVKENISFFDGIKKILNFSMISYSWYINMFIGLYLIIPFLNVLYGALKSQKEKLIFLFCLFLIIIIPSTFSLLKWDYWYSCYPLFYYFIGLYLNEYKPKCNKWMLFLLIILIIVFQVIIVKYTEFLMIDLKKHSNLFCAIISIMIFLMLYNLNAKSYKKYTTIKNLAKLSLSTFLISYIFDTLFVSMFINKGIIIFNDKFIHLLYIVPLNFILSLLFAMFIHVLIRFIINIKLNICQAINKRSIKSKD